MPLLFPFFLPLIVTFFHSKIYFPFFCPLRTPSPLPPGIARLVHNDGVNILAPKSSEAKIERKDPLYRRTRRIIVPPFSFSASFAVVVVTSSSQFPSFNETLPVTLLLLRSSLKKELMMTNGSG